MTTSTYHVIGRVSEHPRWHREQIRGGADSGDGEGFETGQVVEYICFERDTCGARFH